ncbi:LysR family transcriptional regulator [Luteimonas sp. MC1572]|uniref:LysR family transcriptional regulator n=1 Tax=Luteimonas sp. MC1572 TaxID=2799325 RepID=UPI0018F06B6F|nr:LysR family transcriptional regulator [Luteimonas sp. MC1572]MBJ6982272.1 LysR family transcriptional regulator [Luteimonas sp. MC1572]QQO03544.1 LysR family transcriptional regulator [Luteimonas sp. MC1572]
MRFRQIEVFHAVYTTGSISAAARLLHVSQPSVSKVLNHTQQQLGLELFRLVRGRLVATDQAHALFVEASEVFQRLTSLQKAVGNLKDVSAGRIRLAVVPSLGLHLAPLAITRFRKTHPDVLFDVQALHHDELFEALYERRCDIAIAYDPPMHPRMKRRDIDTAELMLLFDKASLPDVGDSVPMQLLEGRDMVGLTIGGPLGELFNRELRRLDVNVREVVSNQSFYIAAALTRCGAGMAVVDEFTARASGDASTGFRPFAPSLRFKVQSVHLEDRPPSKAAEQFLTLFARVLREARATG